MKNPTSHRPRGFTLIELLIVIAIIAVLAAAGFQAGNFAIKEANKTTALAVCTELEQGITRYFDDYGDFPIEVTTDETIDSNSARGIDMLETLLNMDSTNNEKQIKFINIREGSGNKKGLIYNSDGTVLEGLYDPWGGDYRIALDGDFDEQLTIQPKAMSSPKTLNGRVVAVWSNGADGVEDGVDGKVNDDVTTW